MSLKRSFCLAIGTSRTVVKSISHLQQGFHVVCVRPRPECVSQEAQKHMREKDAGAKTHLIFHHVFICSTPGVSLEPAHVLKDLTFLPLSCNTKQFQGPGVSWQ